MECYYVQGQSVGSMGGRKSRSSHGTSKGWSITLGHLFPRVCTVHLPEKIFAINKV